VNSASYRVSVEYCEQVALPAHLVFINQPRIERIIVTNFIG
jgi:hypothetical protein